MFPAEEERVLERVLATRTNTQSDVARLNDAQARTHVHTSARARVHTRIWRPSDIADMVTERHRRCGDYTASPMRRPSGMADLETERHRQFGDRAASAIRLPSSAMHGIADMVTDRHRRHGD